MDPNLTDLHDLAQLDPARNRTLTYEEMTRGRAQLERVIAGDSDAREPRRSRRWVAAAGVLIGGLAASALVATTMTGGSITAQPGSTPTLSPVSTDQALQLANDCAKKPGTPFTLDPSDFVFSERRDHATVTLIQHGEDRGLLCTRVGSTDTGSQGFDDSSGPSPTPLGADRVRVRFLSSGPFGSDLQSYAYVAGRVGHHVTGVDALTANGRVEATITNGWFIAWWPCDAKTDEITDLVVHLDDGTSTTAPPARFR